MLEELKDSGPVHGTPVPYGQFYITRKSEVSIAVYKKHIKLYRFLNDSIIFVDIFAPLLKEKIDEFSSKRQSSIKYYTVPKANKTVRSRRTNEYVLSLLSAQHKRGLYESLIVSMVSRTEAFLVEVISVVVGQYPEKLTLLMDGQSAIPLDTFLSGNSKEEVLAEVVKAKSEGLTYLPPAKYIDKVERVLSIKLNAETISQFIEAKASRDIIVHGSGVINETYVAKSRDRSRGAVGEELRIDEDYFKSVVVLLKSLSGNIIREVESQFG